MPRFIRTTVIIIISSSSIIIIIIVNALPGTDLWKHVVNVQ